MPKADYAVFEALNPFFEIIQKGLSGLVDGEHYLTQLPMTHSLNSAITSPVGL
jgi:hypothetical protein